MRRRLRSQYRGKRGLSFARRQPPIRPVLNALLLLPTASYCRYHCSGIFEKSKPYFYFFQNSFRCIGFSAQRRNFGKPPANHIIILPAVRNKTGRTILNALRGVGKIPAAARSEGIERTIAEKAVKVPAVHTGVAGEIFTIAVLKKFITHKMSPSISSRDPACRQGHVPAGAGTTVCVQTRSPYRLPLTRSARRVVVPYDPRTHPRRRARRLGAPV